MKKKNIKLKKFYDKVYRKGEEKHFTNLITMGKTSEEYSSILKEIKWRNKKVIDVGCGTGYFAYQVAKKGGNVLGIDYSEEAIRIAKERYQHPNLVYKKIDVSKKIIEKFDVVVGLSDHTMGSTVPIASIAFGAKIIEKHFILDRDQGGPDSAFSMEPDEFRKMVEDVRNTEKALGEVSFELSDAVREQRKFSRSLFVIEDIKEGDIFTDKNLRVIRPGHGIAPRHYKECLGKTASIDIERGTPLSMDMITEALS